MIVLLTFTAANLQETAVTVHLNAVLKKQNNVYVKRI